MTGRLFSLVAIPLALVGHLLFWGGSATLLRAQMQFGTGAGIDVAALAVAVLGAVLVLAALATVVLGSLGAFIVGGVQILFSAAFHLVPVNFPSGSFAPAFDIMNAVRSFSMEVSDGMYYYFPPGAGVITGAVFVGAALAVSWRRRVPVATTAQVLAAVSGLVGLLGLGLALAGGAGAYMNQLMMLRPANPLDLVLLYGGAALVGLCVVAARWSSIGALLAGGVVVVVALIGLAAPMTVIGALPADLDVVRRLLQIAVPSGILLLLGLALLVAGLAVRWRARRM